MNSLPALDSASFDAHLPFAVEPLPDGQCPSRLERQTRLALQVMAAPTETPEDANPLLQRLEAKIDLALEMALLSQHPERPPLTHCRLGLNAIAWQSQEPYPVGSCVQVSLCPNPDSALLLYLAARIQSCKQNGAGGYQLSASLDGSLDDATHRLWERWVFRRHRRAINGY